MTIHRRHWKSKMSCILLHRLQFQMFSIFYVEKIASFKMHIFVIWNEIIANWNWTISQRYVHFVLLCIPKYHGHFATGFCKSQNSFQKPDRFMESSLCTSLPASSIEQYCIYNILFPACTYFLFHGRKEVINNDPTVMWMKENISRTINSSMMKKEKM